VWRVFLYLDPFAPFKSIAADAGALEYNRRNRDLMLPYVRRWATIALACAAGIELLAVLAGLRPMLAVPILGLELGFSAATCMLVLSVAVYWALGLRD
jgi:hypothetical protein